MKLLITLATAFICYTSSISTASAAIASWYGGGEPLNSHTASGELFNPNAMTAAHRTLPFGSKVRVTNKRNNESVVVRINDRGPFVKGRIIDLSKGAARAIHCPGLCDVRIDLLERGGSKVVPKYIDDILTNNNYPVTDVTDKQTCKRYRTCYRNGRHSRRWFKRHHSSYNEFTNTPSFAYLESRN